MPSVMQCIGTPNGRHNMEISYRETLEHVVPELCQYNEIIEKKSVEEIYKEYLQPSFEKFNEKQKRKDRRLDVKYNCTTYLEYQRELDKRARQSSNEITKQGRPPIREIVWQFGNPEEGYGSLNQTDESRRNIKGMLLECHEIAKERYSQLAWGDVVFHADESSVDAEGKEHGSLHLHVSFVPLCYKNKQGTDVQVAFERCLEEMGFSTFEAWKHDLDNIMETVLERHGLERTLVNNNEKHQDSKEFHRQQQKKKETREMEQKLETVRSDLESVQEEKGLLEADINKLQETHNELKPQVEKLNEIVEYVASEADESIKVEDMTIPEKKSIWGKIEAPERVGVFIEGMDKEQAERLMQRVKTDEKIEDNFERTMERSRYIVEEAKTEAETIKTAATAQHNEIVSKAESIIREQHNIIARAKAWAENIKKQYEELAEKVKQLLGQKKSLESEISELKAQKEQLQPLKDEILELARTRDILTGEVENEIAQSQFYVPTVGLKGSDFKEKWARLDKGELLALYKDGTTRVVTRNPQGGFDYKSLDDEQAGLCRIGWFKQEEKITIPRNLLKELISVRDKEKPISQNLANMIGQQNTANRVIDKVKDKNDGHGDR